MRANPQKQNACLLASSQKRNCAELAVVLGVVDVVGPCCDVEPQHITGRYLHPH